MFVAVCVCLNVSRRVLVSARARVCEPPHWPSGKVSASTATDRSLNPALVNRLVGLVVKASASRAEDPGFESRWGRDFFGVESYQ